MSDWAWLESTRYYMALVLWLTLPPAIVYWLLLHPLAAFWRRLGVGATFASLFVALGATGWVAWHFRGPFLADSYPVRGVFVVIGLLLYVLAVVIEKKCRKHLKLRILVGVPELSAEQPGVLLTEGIYGHTRNPRYLDLIIAITGLSLIVNYHGMYWLFVATCIGIYAVVLLEERELRQRFGAAYDEYCRQVPRFIPRSWKFLQS